MLMVILFLLIDIQRRELYVDDFKKCVFNIYLHVYAYMPISLKIRYDDRHYQTVQLDTSMNDLDYGYKRTRNLELVQSFCCESGVKPPKLW